MVQADETPRSSEVGYKEVGWWGNLKLQERGQQG
jgi:hypothetical protein